MPTITRLSEVRSLAQILPSGTEGGKEFARIVDLLLFYSASRAGKSVNLFSDRSGDYFGLDSLQDDSINRSKKVGFQYKFFPSPLSASHRSEIILALQKADSNQAKLKLKRWVLVTPDDLVQSATKKGGGDVEWFASLKESLSINFDVEHWGHRKLQALFLETPCLCLFYYPELVQDGVAKRITIAETRKFYDRNIAEVNNRIEFIGMSVYKAEATHGVPMEDIYIPVSVIPYPTPSSPQNSARANPLTFLCQGGRNVILGDPGSGKSTLLKFLSVVGSTTSLQERYQAPKDSRLPISVVLRKYADALKGNKNLSLLDYISQTAQADYSIPSINAEFFEFYLSSGQALIFFDGMDELPNATFKQIVRDRINAFLNCYPLATAIITSRIVGYDSAFGFDTKKFCHSSIAPLELSEIETFVQDWYVARIENIAERKANVCDLLRILRNPEQRAIRTLAENPLLLTIVALVHRIDAVLPDERVVLYQKCTETLLNTWHNWKYVRGDDVVRRGRIERTNRRRIETLAQYMHQKAGDRNRKSRAILFEFEVINVLVADILKHDGINKEDEAKDMAEEFLQFIKQKAGLLIEVGDGQYSFIHLTFQEYLTATGLTVGLEMGGISTLWERLRENINDPRWHEVIRLLIAGLKSDESQGFLIKEIIRSESAEPHINTALLLGGLLLDSVKPAENFGSEIISTLFKFLASDESLEGDNKIIGLLGTLASKYPALWDSGFQKIWRQSAELRPSMLLLTLAIDLSDERQFSIMEPKEMYIDKSEIEIFALLFGKHQWTEELSPATEVKLLRHMATLHRLTRNNRFTNFLGCLGQASFAHLPTLKKHEYCFLIQLSLLRNMHGPFNDFYLNNSILTLNESEKSSDLHKAKSSAISEYRLRKSGPPINKNSVEFQTREVVRRSIEKAIRFATPRLLAIMRSDPSHKFYGNLEADKAVRRQFAQQPSRDRALLDRIQGISGEDEEKERNAPIENVESVVLSPNLLNGYIRALLEDFELQPTSLWGEALRTNFIPTVLANLPDFSSHELSRLEAEISEGNESPEVMVAVASFQLYDVWLRVHNGISYQECSPIEKISKITDHLDCPELNIARCIRMIAFGLANDKSLDTLAHSSPSARNVMLAARWTRQDRLSAAIDLKSNSH